MQSSTTQPNAHIGLPSQLPPNSRERLEALNFIRRVKGQIEYSDLYCDDSGNFFCHVKLHKNMSMYLPKSQSGGRPAPPLSDEQAAELGVEFRPSGCWHHVISFTSQPNVLLFRAQQQEFFSARQREISSQQRQSQQHHQGGNHQNNNNGDDASGHSGTTGGGCLDEDDADAWLVDKREHTFSNNSNSNNTGDYYNTHGQ